MVFILLSLAILLGMIGWTFVQIIQHWEKEEKQHD